MARQILTYGCQQSECGCGCGYIEHVALCSHGTVWGDYLSDRRKGPRWHVKTQVALGIVYVDSGNLTSLYVWTRVVEFAVSLSKQNRRVGNPPRKAMASVRLRRPAADLPRRTSRALNGGMPTLRFWRSWEGEEGMKDEARKL